MQIQIAVRRGIEAGIFEATRRWLEGDHSRVFHLVVDELHTYRGTPGTEVAYLLRVMLDRLGLTPNSDQLRIIAASASLDPGANGLAFLEGFFGRNRNRFYVERGTPQMPDATAIQQLQPYALAFRDYARGSATAEPDEARLAAALHQAVGCTAPASAGRSQQLLYEVAQHTHTAEAIRSASLDPHGCGLRPQNGGAARHCVVWRYTARE